MRRYQRITSFVGISILLCIIGSYVYVEQVAAPHIFSQVNTVPYHMVGVIPGTAKTAPNGLPNVFFTERINAAVQLYQAEKISRILISGDNGHAAYNEPEDMKLALIDQGIPQDHIVLDYAGFRTLDTVVRANNIFGQSDILFISQEFQNKRAIVIGKKHDIVIDGYNTRTIPFRAAPRVYVREIFARGKMMLDLFILHTQPKFLGEPIIIT